MFVKDGGVVMQCFRCERNAKSNVSMTIRKNEDAEKRMKTLKKMLDRFSG